VSERAEARRDERPSAPVVLRSEELFGRRREVIIEHRGAAYRLRITKADKLILTK
jgi:hemin uptake protein HemP